jgi:hypothetical protein
MLTFDDVDILFNKLNRCINSNQIVEIKFMHATSNGLAPSHYMLRSKFAPASMVISLLRNHYIHYKTESGTFKKK